MSDQSLGRGECKLVDQATRLFGGAVRRTSIEGMLGRKHDIRHAKAGIRPRREHLDRDARVDGPATARRKRAPSERPIQLRCMVFTRSGQSRLSRASSNSSA